MIELERTKEQTVDSTETTLNNLQKVELSAKMSSATLKEIAEKIPLHCTALSIECADFENPLNFSLLATFLKSLAHKSSFRSLSISLPIDPVGPFKSNANWHSHLIGDSFLGFSHLESLRISGNLFTTEFSHFRHLQALKNLHVINGVLTYEAVDSLLYELENNPDLHLHQLCLTDNFTLLHSWQGIKGNSSPVSTETLSNRLDKLLERLQKLSTPEKNPSFIKMDLSNQIRSQHLPYNVLGSNQLESNEKWKIIQAQLSKNLIPSLEQQIKTLQSHQASIAIQEQGMNQVADPSLLMMDLEKIKEASRQSEDQFLKDAENRSYFLGLYERDIKKNPVRAFEYFNQVPSKDVHYNDAIHHIMMLFSNGWIIETTSDAKPPRDPSMDPSSKNTHENKEGTPSKIANAPLLSEEKITREVLEQKIISMMRYGIKATPSTNMGKECIEMVKKLAQQYVGTKKPVFNEMNFEGVSFTLFMQFLNQMKHSQEKRRTIREESRKLQSKLQAHKERVKKAETLRFTLTSPLALDSNGKGSDATKQHSTLIRRRSKSF